MGLFIHSKPLLIAHADEVPYILSGQYILRMGVSGVAVFSYRVFLVKKLVPCRVNYSFEVLIEIVQVLRSNSNPTKCW